MWILDSHDRTAILKLTFIWRPPSLSELTPYCISLGLTHLGSEGSNLTVKYYFLVVKITKEFTVDFSVILHISYRIKTDYVFYLNDEYIVWNNNNQGVSLTGYIKQGSTHIYLHIYLFKQTKMKQNNFKSPAT